ncbi:MAG TPA: sulfatase-like hydrolase/transferase [Thermoanaerobaculia bacterium]|nr:sulfatase-like hydrolase/transferase [Thermoanaerobaculia bacterium]
MKKTLAILIAAVCAVSCSKKESSSTFGGGPDPDIILVTIDTLRVDALSRNNHGAPGKSKTPFLDAMASEGVYYEHAHAHNVITFPSHTNILTGLLPYQHGVRDNAGFTLDPKHKTIAPMLKERGYATGAFVAAYPLDRRFGLTPGFDVYDDKYPEGTAPKAFVVPERKAVEVFAAAQKWYDSVAEQKKFMWVHIYEPHQPYKPDSPWREQYANPYYAEVAEADDVLGKFLRPLLERRPNTMVIITGDHGEGMGEHGEITHGLFAYEETLAIPLILWEKGKIQPHVETRYVGHRDIVPTILDRIGAPKPAELTGMSLFRLDDKPRNSYFEALTASLNLGWAPLVGMISDGHKYIDLPLAELYDLEHDPVEKKNILTENRRMTIRIRQMLTDASPMQNVGDRSISTDESQKLRSLGYLSGTAAAKKEYTAADDPKNLVHVFSAIHKAVDEYQHGKVEDALHRAQKIVHDRPEMSMARDFLAFMYQETENPAAAEKVLRDTIAIGIANDEVKQRLGLLLSENGRAAEAVEVLSQFAAKTTNPDLLNAYGIALADLGRLDEAMQQFQRVLTIDATNATAYQNMGVTALRAGDGARAQQFLVRALQLNKDLPLALNTLGVVYARNGNFPLALDAWKRAVTIDPKQYDALYNIGLVEGRAGNRAEAKRALTQFVQTAPPKKYGADIATARRALVALQ